MATIIRFSIAPAIAELLTGYDLPKVVNAIQSELNMGAIVKSSTKQTDDWKNVKDDDGNERLVLDVKTKTGETLRLESTIGNRFFGWCRAIVKANTFATTEVKLPDVFKTWLDKFATK